ncbi:hypothetical protein [Acinetobacter ursingii]|uniref:hypothetical protein n=1 Tax=Acinetobacter ursingii TaxID=108980 RepID=UPI00124D02DE|nr:hypothetical protein [Acinetobacter ursingii]
MEKYLRLLNPKTTNFDAIGGGNHGAMTAQDVCIALSYAKFTDLQEILFGICLIGVASVEQIKVSTKKINIDLNKKKLADLSEDFEISIFIALVELSKVPASYKPSVRNRAVIGGVSKDRIQRKLNQKVNDILEIFNHELDIIRVKLEYQFRVKNN